MSIMRLESDALYDEAPPDAPRANGDPDTGVRASLYRGMHRAKRALAGALLGFALVLPERQEPRDLEALDVDGFEEAMRAYDVDHDEGGTDDGGSDDGGGGSDGSGSAASPAAARGPSASGGSRPALKRFGTLKRLEDDEEWAAVTEPAPEESLNLSSPEDPSAPPAAPGAPSAHTPPPAPPPSRSSASGASATGPPSPSRLGLPPGALNLSRLRGGPATAWEPPVYGVQISKQDYTAVASDGWTLHIVHTTDRGVAPEARRRHPVLLCPGLASSGVGTFDLMPEVSIVDYLASKGWDVWCVCLRGNGASDKESKIDLSSWTIDDHLFQDVPAVLQFVLNKTGTEQVHWIGHSMGGMLGCGLLSQGDSSRYSETLKSLTMYGSGCFGDGSWHSLLKRIVVPVTRMGFPADLACQGMSLLTDKPAALSVFETLFYWFPNVEKHVRKRLLQSCFNYIPTTLTGQFLDSHDSPNGLMNVRHTFKYADPEVLGETAVPVLAVNGDWDLFCPAAGGKKTADLFGGPKKAITIGKAHGHCSHYGHFDVIVGRSAKDEVWPQVLKFLEDNDD